MPIFYEPYHVRRAHPWDGIEYIISPTTDCWEVVGRPHAPSPFWGESKYYKAWRNGRLVYLHRYVYELTFGEIPRGLCVCHSCDNTECINPEHLFLGTHKDNMQDAAQKGRLGFQGAKLTEADAQAILEDRTYSPEWLARKYRVTVATVRAIKDRKSWTHLVIKD